MRTTTRRLPVTATAIAAALLLAGCSSSEPTAVAVSGDSAPVAAVDKAALDTGAFPTTPQPDFGTATAGSMPEIEGQRMAEFTVLPYEINETLLQATMPTLPLKSGSALALLLSNDAGRIADEQGMVTGFSTSAKDGSKENGKSIVHSVWRFPNNESATKAAQQIHQSILTVDEYKLGNLPTEQRIDVLPNTLVSNRESARATVSTNALTVHGDYVIYTWAEAPAAEKDWNTKTISKALKLQEPMIDQFPATPLTNEVIEKFKIDQDGVLKYTIPTPAEEDRSTAQLAVYGPRGMAHMSSDPAYDYELLQETGTDKVAKDFTNIYRTKSPEDAQKLMDGFVESNLAHGWIKAESPVGLPDASCMIKETSAGDHHGCFAVNGRYMGEVSGADNKEEVRQAISAQYLVLEGAE